MAKWEYRVLEYDIKGGIMRKMDVERNYLNDLNEVGRDGWELVGIIPFTENQGRLSRVHLILKKG